MADESETLLAGEYFLAVEGLAMIRTCLVEPSAARPRAHEIKKIIARFQDFPNSLSIPMTEHDVEDGYTRWAPRYDSPNPAIALESPIVRTMVEQAPLGRALDAACGTGRHAMTLAELGYEVLGVDTTEAMLVIARDKVPEAQFQRGTLEELPANDASVDLLTCGLALTHVAELEPIMREFARVLRPGGQAVLSDIHPFATMTGAMAAFRDRDEDITKGIPFVVNLTHQLSEYIESFLAAGLSILACVEPRITEPMLPVFPSYVSFPEATRQAFVNTPYLVIWRVERSA